MESHPSAYINTDGQPLLLRSIVAFIDILGFSQMSTSHDQTQDSQHVLDKIVTAIEDSRAFVRKAFKDEAFADPSRWSMKFFSDNLAFGCPIGESAGHFSHAAWFVIQCTQRYQLSMSMNGVFVRGALADGLICLTDDIIFGSALVQCYQLESKASVVPRVILSEELRKSIHSSDNADSEIRRDDLICRDVDGWWFVNYLQATREASGINWDFIERHKRSILESLSATTRHDVLPKYGWACRYHNVFCHWHRDDPGYSDRFKIDRVDEQSTIYRLSESGEI